MGKQRVLYVMHNHPAVYPGGAEAYAYELYEALRDSDRVDPLLVARIGSSSSMKREPHAAAPFSTVTPNDPNQFFLYTDWETYEWFQMTSRDKSVYATHLADFLRIHRPDVVHFQHIHTIGWDAVSHTRRVLPHVPIVFTLHEYLSICHRDGQMLRRTGELCKEASPRRCHECFPDIPAADFFLRERFIKSHADHVDMFLAPSQFLLERYVDWGIPRERIRFEDYGRVPQERAPERPQEPGTPRTRIAFFGQLNYYKGVDVLLDAMTLLNEKGVDAHLTLNGANLQLQTPEFQQEFNDLLETTRRTGHNVAMRGSYSPEDRAQLMAEADWVVVPSRWWENSPLVIQEAFLHGRPVICADIGGMAEKVTDGVNGLHFHAGDPASLAATLERAVTTPGLWEELRAGDSPVYSMDEHVASLTDLYTDLLARRVPGEQALAR
jgi:glycosyltransferase involved in cell wall biosynthesis